MTAPQRTYWHLLGERRMPTEYEVLTSRLGYHAGRGFGVRTPAGAFFTAHASALACEDWERFADPRETTYASYTRLQRDAEAFVDGLFASMEASGYDAALPPGALALFAEYGAVLRYPLHALQMLASYVGQAAPCGRVTVVALFQAGDEMRRVQRLAYRLAALRLAHPGLGDDSRARWEGDPAWQPLRETVEHLLVAYDFDEAFVGLSLCVKPWLDELVLVHLGRAARREGDYLLGELFFSLNEDCRWHRRWAGALVRLALDAAPENRAALQRLVDRWGPRAARAACALAPGLGADVRPALEASYAAYLLDLGLRPPVAPGPQEGLA